MHTQSTRYMNASFAKLALLSASVAAMSSAAFAGAGAATPVSAPIKAAIKQALKTLPSVDNISATPITGLYEVRSGTHILYTDATGRYLMESAQLVDLKTKTNLTNQSVGFATAIAQADLPLKSSFVTHKEGAGANQIVIFADPNCGYCKRLEGELGKLKNVTIRTVAIPILGEDSKMKVEALSCNSDIAKTWTNWMSNGATIPEPKAGCTGVQEAKANLDFAVAHSITSTPTIFMPNGFRQVGGMPAEQLQQLIDANKAAAH